MDVMSNGAQLAVNQSPYGVVGSIPSSSTNGIGGLVAPRVLIRLLC